MVPLSCVVFCSQGNAREHGVDLGITGSTPDQPSTFVFSANQVAWRWSTHQRHSMYEQEARTHSLNLHRAGERCSVWNEARSPKDGGYWASETPLEVTSYMLQKVRSHSTLVSNPKSALGKSLFIRTKETQVFSTMSPTKICVWNFKALCIHYLTSQLSLLSHWRGEKKE